MEGMETTSISKKKWIDSGYKLFVSEGMGCLNVERLSKAMSYNKSGFYYYFPNRETYLKEVMLHHFNSADRLIDDLKSIYTFDPDFLLLLIKHSDLVLAHMQTAKHLDNEVCLKCYESINEKVEPYVIPSWARFINYEDNQEFAKNYFVMVRDIFYLRVTKETLNYNFLKNLVNESKALLKQGHINHDINHYKNE
jgi:AcrR family transcriptional regulator